MKNSKIIFIILCLTIFISGCDMKKDRLIVLEGSFNTRDLGGYKTADGKTVKWNLVYRSDDLANLTNNDLNTLEKLNIKTIIDFRTESEQRRAPDKVPSTVKNIFSIISDVGDMSSINVKEITNDSGANLMIKGNEYLVENSKKQYTQFFQILMNENSTPLIFHCSAGKDRAGFAAAMFLSSLGVDRETIYEDYMLSAKYATKKYQYLIDESPNLAALMTVKREYLKAAFDKIDKEYGGIENYLKNELNVDLDLMRSIYTE